MVTVSGETLGKLVNSSEHYRMVYRLAVAAVEKGKKVQIHVMGEGLECIEKNGFDHLCRIAQVTVCEAGLRALEDLYSITLPETAVIASPRFMNTILCGCDRTLTF